MTDYTDYRPREIVFDTTGILKKRLDAVVPHGQKGKLLFAIIGQIVDMLENDDAAVLRALIIADRVKLSYKIKDVDSERSLVSNKT